MTNVFGTATPANVDGTTTTPKAIQQKISIATGGTVSGIRLYSTPTMAAGTLGIQVYSAAGTMLTDSAVVIDTAVGWHFYAFTAPITLTAGAVYRMVYGKASGTFTYAYALATLPITANGITISASKVTSGTGWADLITEAAINEFDNYYIDIELSGPLSVDAGVDQSIFSTAVASLTATPSGGSGSKTYTWTKVSGPTGAFSAPSSASTTFSPTGGVGTYTLRCIVTDTSGTAQDDVVITVTAAPTLVGFATIESSTGWTPTGGTMLAVLSDDSDSTLATTTDNPSNVLFDGYLPVIQVPGSGQNFVSRVRCDRPGSSSGSLTAKLYEGATLRSTVTAAIPSSIGDVNIAFPASDLTAIAPASWTTVVTGTRTAMRVSIAATAAV